MPRKFLCNLITVILLLISIQSVQAQKKAINYSTYKEWPVISGEKLSDDGKYIMYSLGNIYMGIKLILKSTESPWSKEIMNCRSEMSTFCRNSLMAIVKLDNDSLAIFQLGESTVKYMTEIANYEVVGLGNKSFLIYSKKEEPNNIFIKDLDSEMEKSFVGIKKYFFSEEGKLLLLVKGKGRQNSDTSQLILLNLALSEEKIIWEGVGTIENIAFNNNGKKFLFISTTQINSSRNSNVIWCYSTNSEKAKVVISDSALSNNNNLYIVNGGLRFLEDDDKIIFRTKRENKFIKEVSPKKSSGSPEIWNYKAPFLANDQIQQDLQERSHTTFLDIRTKKMLVITAENEDTIAIRNNFVLICKPGDGNQWESNWNKLTRPSYYVFSLINGSKTVVSRYMEEAGMSNIELSPRGKYVIYYDVTDKCYHSLNTETNTNKCITDEIETPLYNQDYDEPGFPRPFPYDFSKNSWGQNDSWVLLYDHYDIWQVDPSGEKHPVNITNGYGQIHKTIFRITNENTTITDNTCLNLYAFNTDSKNSGFFRKYINTKGDPQLLTMGPYLYTIPPTGETTKTKYVIFPETNLPEQPFIKAKNCDQYLVRRSSVNNAPNLYTTKKFKDFIQLSFLQPECDYNWMTSELVHWNDDNNKKNTGILYKPKNFDPSKKYPLIFYCYEKLSDGLNQYLIPQLRFGDLSITYYVSNGYLVFLPDIDFTIGNPGLSIINTVGSAAKYLYTLPFVDSSKLGIQGISYGGYVVNYLITHTNIFCAAASSAGPTDLVSGYGSIAGDGHSFQHLYENGQTRIGGTLWEKPNSYIENSPIFYVDKIQTPLLIMHNKKDGNVPWNQGIELFTGMRRLQKKVWLLQYENGAHGIGGEEAFDFSIRLSQFFDYYLKNEDPPIWMTTVSSSSPKENESDLTLDKSGTQP